MNVTSVKTKAYDNEQRTMNNEQLTLFIFLVFEFLILCLQTPKICIQLLFVCDNLFPGDLSAFVRSHSAEYRYKIAPHARRNRRIIEFTLDNTLMERRNIGHGSVFIYAGAFAAAIEYIALAPNQHIPPVLRFEHALRAEHTIPDARWLGAVPLELLGAERNAHIIRILE